MSIMGQSFSLVKGHHRRTMFHEAVIKDNEGWGGSWQTGCASTRRLLESSRRGNSMSHRLAAFNMIVNKSTTHKQPHAFSARILPGPSKSFSFTAANFTYFARTVIEEYGRHHQTTTLCGKVNWNGCFPPIKALNWSATAKCLSRGIWTEQTFKSTLQDQSNNPPLILFKLCADAFYLLILFRLGFVCPSWMPDREGKESLFFPKMVNTAKEYSYHPRLTSWKSPTALWESPAVPVHRQCLLTENKTSGSDPFKAKCKSSSTNQLCVLDRS